MGKVSQATPFGERIRARRQALELDQIALAALVGVTQQTISNWETEGIIPKTSRIIELAQLLQCKPEWLAFGVGTPELEEDLDK
jgi:transcriptional regulator with XRE-family HTH domain